MRATGCWFGCLAILIPIQAAPAADGPAAPQFQKKLTADEQILQALNRLGFGPKPGDVERVRTMGLENWIDLQLHPARIPENPLLLEKLKPLASLRMSSREIAEKYNRPKRRFSDEKKEQIPPIDSVLTAEEIQLLRSGTLDQKVALLRPLPDARLRAVVHGMAPGTRGQLLSSAPGDLRRRLMEFGNPGQVIAYDLDEGKLYRAIYGNRQLEEVLTDFWFNHFNVCRDKGADRVLLTAYERDVIRPRVLGKFKDLLLATAKSPAMLYYLDNWESAGPKTEVKTFGFGGNGGLSQMVTTSNKLNENYARELMELHTLGVDGGYTQKDIVEVARCFTGWTVKAPDQGGEFEFNPKLHDTGVKNVFDVKIAAHGKDEGLKVLDLLAHHPSTARFVSRRLAQRFVADDPPKAVVDRMARTFSATDGDLREVMLTMLKSDEFRSAGAYRSKVKSPLEMVASAARALDADVDYAYGLSNQIAQLGQPLYRKVEPTGYPNLGSEWMNSNSLLGRMNLALALAGNRLQGVKVDLAKLGASDNDSLALVLLGTLPSAPTRAAIANASEGKAPQAALIAGLLLGSPDFQRR